MAQFEALEPGIEVDGKTLIAVVDGLLALAETALDILARNGIGHPEPGAWYPQQACLNAFREIAERVGPLTLYNVGQKIAESADCPPGVRSVEQALRSFDATYKTSHRGGEIGSYSFTTANGTSGIMVCRNPYPCEFDRGLLSGIARRFRPEGAGPACVVHDDAAPCRKRGAESCTYQVHW